jgi:hypothetical protein
MRIRTGNRKLRSLCLALGAVVAALAVAACDDDTPGPTPTPPPPPTVTDTFAGTLNRNGAFTFPFDVLASGSMAATLTTVSDTTIAVSLSLGTFNGTTCQVQLANDQALQGAVVAGVASAIGRFCVRISDVGKVVDPIDFTITMVHP